MKQLRIDPLRVALIMIGSVCLKRNDSRNSSAVNPDVTDRSLGPLSQTFVEILWTTESSERSSLESEGTPLCFTETTSMECQQPIVPAARTHSFFAM